jgi:hypothetical protein
MPSILLRSAPSGASELLELRQLEIKELLALIVLRLDTIINHLYSITDEEGV